MMHFFKKQTFFFKKRVIDWSAPAEMSFHEREAVPESFVVPEAF